MVFKHRERTRKLVLAGAVAFMLAGTGAALAWPAGGPSLSPSSDAPPSITATPAPPGHQDKQHREDRQHREDKAGKEHREDKTGKEYREDKAGKQSGPGKRHDKADHARGGRLQHSESVVKDADGGFRTILVQRGTVEAVSGTSVTVRSEDGYSQTYAVDANTRTTGHGAALGHRPPAADDDKQAGPRRGSIADIAVGDAVRVVGVKEGDRVLATRIAPGGGNPQGENPPGKGR